MKTLAVINTSVYIFSYFQMTKHTKKSLPPTPTKGKGGGKGSSKGKQENMDLKDCPLDFKQFDHLEAHSAPRFFNVLKRPSGDESLGLEDLDGLQLELEALLSNVVVRKRHIKEELDILTNLDKYRGKNKKVIIGHS